MYAIKYSANAQKDEINLRLLRDLPEIFLSGKASCWKVLNHAFSYKNIINENVSIKIKYRN